MTSIHSLPDELLAQFFEYLDTTSKVKSRLVCAKWTRILERYFLIGNVLLANKTMNTVLGFRVPIKTLNVRNLTSKQFLSKTDSSVDFMEPKELIFRKILRKKLQNGRTSVSSENLRCLLEMCCKSVKFLFINYNTLLNNSLADVPVLRFQNLQHLKICINSSSHELENFAQFANIFESRCLEKLQLFNPFQVNRETLFQIYLSYYKIAARNYRTLKVLNLVHPLLSLRNSVAPSDTVPRSSEEGLDPSEVDNLMKMQLLDVYLNLDINEALTPQAMLARDLLKQQVSLRTVHLNFRKVEQVQNWNIADLITKNEKSLQIIDLIASKRCGPPLDIFALLPSRAFHGCGCLRVLRIINFKFTELPLYLPNSIHEMMLWGSMGTASAQIARTARLTLPNLDRFDLYDTNKTTSGHDLLEHEIKLLVCSTRLKEMYIYKHNFNVDFLNHIERPVINVQRMDVRSKWCWPMKIFVLKNTYQIAISARTD